jgi:hypothetical protein
MSDPTEQPRPASDPAGPLMPLGIPPASLSPQVFDEVPWEPSAPPNLVRRWTWGWRLVLLLALLFTGYAAWRGQKDYFRVKAWRGRALARQGAEAAARGAVEEAAALLNSAAILAPQDAFVFRTMADFCEPRRDEMALAALSNVVKSGLGQPADFERLCRLAIDWGHPELAVNSTLQQWAAAPAETLTLTQLRLSGVWLADGGQYDKGVERLRSALSLAADTSEAPGLEVALSRLLMRAAVSEGAAESVGEEALRRLSSVVYSPSAALPLRVDATRLLAGLLLHPARRALLTPLRADLLRTAFTDLATDTAPTEPETAAGYQLGAVSVELITDPDRRPDIIRGVMEQARAAPIPSRLIFARWLNENACPEEAMALCDHTAEKAGDPDWFTVRLDALFAQRAFEAATGLLTASGQPLPAFRQQLFLYRLDRAAGRPPAALTDRRAQLEKANATAEPKNVMESAHLLERAGDPQTAVALYATMKHRPREGLSARLAIVRCLGAQPERTVELKEALQEVLQLYPQSSQARSDLAYLRLLDGKPAEDDLAVVAAFHQQSPWFLAYRISAALAALHRQNPEEALALLQSGNIRWDRAPAGWRAVYAGILSASGRIDEARSLARQIEPATLRPGERKLVAKLIE